MLKQVMTAPGAIVFEEVSVPEIGPQDVLVRMEKIGICGSDVHVWHGQHPFTRYPVTQGHEVSGTVERVGAEVNGLREGQLVTIEPQLVCGTCHPCRHGKYNLCEHLRVMGFQAPGAAQQYFAVDASRVTPLPDGFYPEDGAMIEPLAVAVHAVRRAGDIRGKDVAVIGAGPIGNLVAQAAKGMGARRTLVTDLSDFRLSIARACGVDEAVNTDREPFGDAMVRCFGPDKADFIYDCAGNNASMGQAIAHARKGSSIILVAVFSDPATIDLAVANDHELDILTTMMYRHEDYLDAIRLVQEGKVQLAPLVTARFPLQDYAAAYRHIDQHRETTMKVLVDVWG